MTEIKKEVQRPNSHCSNVRRTQSSEEKESGVGGHEQSGFQIRSLAGESWKRKGLTTAITVVQSGEIQLRTDHQLWQKMDVIGDQKSKSFSGEVGIKLKSECI